MDFVSSLRGSGAEKSLENKSNLTSLRSLQCLSVISTRGDGNEGDGIEIEGGRRSSFWTSTVLQQ